MFSDRVPVYCDKRYVVWCRIRAFNPSRTCVPYSGPHFFNSHVFIFTYTYLSQGAKNSSSSSYGGKATSKSPAKGAKNPSAPITKPSAASSAKKSYDDDDYGYGEWIYMLLLRDHHLCASWDKKLKRKFVLYKLLSVYITSFSCFVVVLYS